MALVGSPGWFAEGEPASTSRRILVARPARGTTQSAAFILVSKQEARRVMLAGAGAFLALSVGSSAPALGTGIETVHRIGASLFASDIAVDAACGALACGTAEICYGIDTLKVRMQSGAKLFDGGLVSSVKGLYDGVWASAGFRVLHGALYMPVYGQIKHALLAAQAPLASAVVASATAATLLVSLIEVPVEALLLRVKTGRASAGFLSAAKAALSAPGGVAALYCGAAPFVLRHVLYESVEFLAYETLRASAMVKAQQAGEGAWEASEIGGHGVGLAPRQAAVLAFAASAVATVASQPLDCIRVACSLSAHGAHASAAGGLTTLGALRSILAAKGPAGLFSGLIPRLATLAPGAVLFFSVFETSKAASLRLRQRMEAGEAEAAAKKQRGAEAAAALPLAVAEEPQDAAGAVADAPASAVGGGAEGSFANRAEPVLALASAQEI